MSMVINLLFTFCSLTQLDLFRGKPAVVMGNTMFLASLYYHRSWSCNVTVEWSNYWGLNKSQRKMNERSSWYILTLLEYLESSRSLKLHYISVYAGFDHLRMHSLTRPNSWRIKWLWYTSMRLRGWHHHPSHIIYTVSILVINLHIPSTCSYLLSMCSRGEQA